MSISVTVDAGEIAGLSRWFGKLDKVAARANRRALKKAADKARSLAVKEIAARESVKQKSVRRRLKVFAAPRTFLGESDFIRIWLGLGVAIKPKDDKKVLRGFRTVFSIPKSPGAKFTRRPNKLASSPKSTHQNPSALGKANPKRSGLPIDRVQVKLKRSTMLPIIIRHARHAAVNVYPGEFRRLLELNARRAAGR